MRSELKISKTHYPEHIKLAYLPSFGKVRLRLSGRGSDKESLERELQEKVSEIQQLISDIIVGLEDGYSIEKRIGELLVQHQKTLATAESLTGGKIAASLVSVPGASAFFKGSFVTYSAEAKKACLEFLKKPLKILQLLVKRLQKKWQLLQEKN